MRQYAAEALKGIYQGEPLASPYPGGRTAGLQRLEAFDVAHYGAQQNRAGGGATSELSPYIRHGLLSLREVRDSVVGRFGARASRGFVLQLLWRVFWYLVYPERKERPAEKEHAEEPIPLPQEPLAPSDVRCMNELLQQLRERGFLSYEARLWVASYLLHWRGADWREGGRLFNEHLVDADPVVNSLSWRWVLGEFTGQPYLFNRARLSESTGGEYCGPCATYRCPFDGGMDAVEERLRKPGARR